MSSTSRAKRVCVIGGGPSGLVAAKTFAHTSGPQYFHVTVLEASDRIGGLWPCAQWDAYGLVNPDMRTNQSRHTVAFSDFAWPETTSLFPRAWEVGKYLEAYKQFYRGYKVELGKRVKRIERRLGEEEEGGGGWSINVMGEEVVREFDHVVIATGIFGKPKWPTAVKESSIPVWHSSEVRDIRTGEQKLGAGHNIVVVGGQMSGVEISAAIAFQISDEVNRPKGRTLAKPEKLVVVHVASKASWVMALFFPQNPYVEVQAEDGTVVTKRNPAPTFLPLDLVTYDLGQRPPGPIVNTSGHITAEAAVIAHGFMESYVGTDQSDLGVAGLAMRGELRREPPLVTCSDQYTEFVRQQNIKIVQGKMKSVSKESRTVEVEDGNGNITTIDDVAAIICATGFDAASSVDFLPDEILKAHNFDPTDDGFPLTLDVHSSASKHFPSLGFVGYYRSPYWGVMEMQARYLCKLWSGDEKALRTLKDDQSAAAALKLRTDPRRAQFPMGDYVYLMESFADILDIRHSDAVSAPGRRGIVLGPHYLALSSTARQQDEAAKMLSAVDACQGGFVRRAVFRGLQGIWSLRRSIISRMAMFPSGVLCGTARFLPRQPTHRRADGEYLYVEEGQFCPSSGGAMSAKRCYIWHYAESFDTLDVWFAKDDDKTADYRFHELLFLAPDNQTSGGWRATSSHLCINDLYNVAYEFSFSGATLRSWSSTYIVKGPNKDYTIENKFTRPDNIIG